MRGTPRHFRQPSPEHLEELPRHSGQQVLTGVENVVAVVGGVKQPPVVVVVVAVIAAVERLGTLVVVVVVVAAAMLVLVELAEVGMKSFLASPASIDSLMP